MVGMTAPDRRVFQSTESFYKLCKTRWIYLTRHGRLVFRVLRFSPIIDERTKNLILGWHLRPLCERTWRKIGKVI